MARTFFFFFFGLVIFSYCLKTFSDDGMLRDVEILNRSVITVRLSRGARARSFVVRATENGARRAIELLAKLDGA